METKLKGPKIRADQNHQERERKPSKSLKNWIRNEKCSNVNPDEPNRKQESSRNGKMQKQEGWSEPKFFQDG